MAFWDGLKKVTGVISAVANFIPGVGQIVSIAAAGVSFAAGLIDNGQKKKEAEAEAAASNGSTGTSQTVSHTTETQTHKTKVINIERNEINHALVYSGANDFTTRSVREAFDSAIANGRLSGKELTALNRLEKALENHENPQILAQRVADLRAATAKETRENAR